MLGFDEIRLAQPEDEDALFQFVKLMHAENGLFPLSETQARIMIRHATDRRGGVIAIIDGPDGSIEASMCAVVEPHWYTVAMSLNERWNFVRQDCRKTSHARRLIEFAKAVGNELGIPVFMGVLSTHRTEAKVRLYRRQLEPVGGFFAHGLGRPALTTTH